MTPHATRALAVLARLLEEADATGTAWWIVEEHLHRDGIGSIGTPGQQLHEVRRRITIEFQVPKPTLPGSGAPGEPAAEPR